MNPATSAIIYMIRVIKYPAKLKTYGKVRPRNSHSNSAVGLVSYCGKTANQGSQKQLEHPIYCMQEEDGALENEPGGRSHAKITTSVCTQTRTRNIEFTFHVTTSCSCISNSCVATSKSACQIAEAGTQTRQQPSQCIRIDMHECMRLRVLRVLRSHHLENTQMCISNLYTDFPVCLSVKGKCHPSHGMQVGVRVKDYSLFFQSWPNCTGWLSYLGDSWGILFACK